MYSTIAAIQEGTHAGQGVAETAAGGGIGTLPMAVLGLVMLATYALIARASCTS